MCVCLGGGGGGVVGRITMKGVGGSGEDYLVRLPWVFS